MDVEERQVFKGEADQICKGCDPSMPYLEISAKENLCIEDVSACMHVSHSIPIRSSSECILYILTGFCYTY